ncbi:protein NRT1/ PTR FAMILY 2.11-like [Magnolia sinica]|uniref:protein NRT1/ PTR FAMILY 2.11-like n=1 Tax=Magnolia sinica TaxID=86752 RepID=UPI0026594C84|nr:protein NRT1/ PTR FAMILY 2.11-like [Magnolia sinica]
MQASMEKPEKLEAIQDKKKHRGWKAMPYIIGNETFEKLGTIGTTSNLMIYLTTIFNMKRVSAALLINIWSGTTNLAPLFGAFLSDSYFGRFKTLGFASIASLMGMLLVMLTAAIAKLHPPHCGTHDAGSCVGPTPLQMAFLLFGLGFLVVGAGGIRPCNLAFGADQFDQSTESGRRGVNSFFNWYFFTFTFAMMVSLTVIIYVQDKVSWALGFGIPTFLMFLSCVFFFIGSSVYVKIKPEGSPFVSIIQVLTAAIRKRGLKRPDGLPHSLFNPVHKNSINTMLPYTDQFRFLDKAAILTVEDKINADGSAADQWRLCSIQQVEELKCLLRVIPVWSSGILFFIPIVQNSTYVVVQAQQSDRHLGSYEISAASFTIFAMITMTIWIPIYDRILVPFIRRLTGKEGGITLLQRMGAGVFLSIFSMLVSGLVERHRRYIALHHPTLGTASGGGAISSMSALWLVPQLGIAGLSEAFSAIGQVEFYYKQFPENMRSVAGSLLFIGMACSNYLSSLMVAIVHQTTNRGGAHNWLPEDLNNGRLEYFYFLIAGLGIVNFGYFLACSRWYRYKDTDGPSEIAMESNGSKAHPV